MTQTNEEQERTEKTVALFERLLREGHYLVVDMLLLDRMNSNEDSYVTVLGILTLTSYAKADLKNRDTYLRWAERNMRHALGDKRATHLLKNRR